MTTIEEEKTELREHLERDHGQVLETKELQEKYRVISFLAPFVTVENKENGLRGTMQFTHLPRFYYNFKSSENIRGTNGKPNEISM